MPTEFYASQSGSSLNSGTKASPWSIPYLLGGAGGSLADGGLVTLLAGLYRGDWTTALSGANINAPVTLRAAPGERVVWDGSFTATGSDFTLWGTRITCQSPDRISLQGTTFPDDIPGRYGKTAKAAPGAVRIKWINNRHDNGSSGIGDAEGAIGTEWTGVRAHSVGWGAPDRGHGHLQYIQNYLIQKLVQHSFFFSSFDIAEQIGGTGGAHIMNMLERYITAFMAGAAMSPFSEQRQLEVYGGGDFWPDGCKNLTFQHFRTYQPSTPSTPGGSFTLIQAADTDKPGNNIVLEDSLIHGVNGFLGPCTASAVRRTKITTGDYTANATNKIFISTLPTGAAYNTNEIDYLDLFSPDWGADNVVQVKDGTGAVHVFTDNASLFATTGYNEHGTLTKGKPVGFDIFVDPNPYEVGRGHITCFNWGQPGVTGVAATNVLTKTAHGFTNGTKVGFTFLVGGAGLALDIQYFVVGATANTLQLSTTLGGAAFDFTTDITDATVAPMFLDIALASVLSVGDLYVIHNVFDEDGPPVLSGTYAGGTVSLSMGPYTPPKPIGYHATPPSPGIKFNGFVVRKVASTALPDGVPSGLAGTPAGPSSLNLTWTNNSTNEIGIIIERKQAWSVNAPTTGDDWIIDAILPAGSTSATIVGLPAPAAPYEFRGKSYTDAGESTPSASATVSTTARGTQFVGDTMAGAPDTQLTSRAGELGATWTKHPTATGNAAITDQGRVRPETTTTVVLVASGDPDTPDVDVEWDMFVASTGTPDRPGMVIRLDPVVANMYEGRYESGFFEIVRRLVTAPGSLTLGQYGMPLVAGNTYHCKFTGRGAELKLYVDDLIRLTRTDPYITAKGKIGLRFQQQSSVGNAVGLHVDNVSAFNA